MQLVAYGAQDIYLTGNPQITFFKVVYRRHTNFSMESIEQTINGTSTIAGGTGNVTISRNGDLVHRVYVSVSSATVTNGSKIVSEVELEIGGQKIDKHYEEWNNIWNELSTTESKSLGLKCMQGDIGTGATPLVQVPLNFWFCRNPGLALPLIALQYHEVKLKFTWGTEATTGAAGADTAKVYCDYIYLDTDERRRFAQVSHEYLIEQVQKQAANTTTDVKLNFNHPVKELIWTSPIINAYTTAKLVLNGHDRFSAQEEEYFQLRQPFDYHTAVPRQNLPSAAQVNLLDRQTTLAAPNNGYVTAVRYTHNADAGGAAGRFTWVSIPQVLIYRGAAAHVPANAAGLTVGSELIVVSQDNSTPGNSGAFSCIVNSVVTGGNAHANLNTADVANVTLTVSLPQDLDGGGNIMFGGDSAANDTITIFKVTNGNATQARTSQMTDKINVYSFGLKPEEHQPSGTCNFSRIDNATLKLGVGLLATNNIYAVNYNVLRIMSGMGGLAYSN